MKKITIIALFLLIGFQSIAQENTTSEENKKPADKTLGSNEVSLNVVYLLAGIPEIGYQYILNNESSMGVDIMFAIDPNIDFKFALTPYYRVFFGKKRAAGFFVEGFGMVNVINDNFYGHDDYYDYPGSSYSYEGKDEANFALGVSVGGKFMTNSGFIFEIYGGTGRNLINNETNGFVPRAGVTFGKRF